MPDENSTIGIILCKERDNIVVEYALRNIRKPIGVARYYLTRKLPAKLLKQLPSPSVIENKLKELEGKKKRAIQTLLIIKSFLKDEINSDI